MRVQKRKKIRKFIANKDTNVILSDVGKIILNKNEHLTIQANNKKNEICMMEWGLYATSSINNRLKKEGFETALVKNSFNKFFIMIVDNNKKKIFFKYCKKESIKVVQWLDKMK